ncbi:hypothetical protein HZ996_06195 [Cryomorphaceae bacterium]|nr:hypothetical protein HZ996_06195 [Cryomorphaceae bacterium]
METQHIDLSAFDHDPEHFGDRRLAVTIKSFDLQAIRARYLASKQNKSGRRGSVERREAGIGGVAYVELQNGQLRSEIIHRMKEPRGIDASGDCFAIAAESTVFVFDSGRTYRLHYPWFSYIHTIAFSPHRDHTLLIASSGLDCIFEFDYRSGKLLWEWYAWENGFNQSFDAEGKEQYLCRTLDQKTALEQAGKKAKWIKDPVQDSLPTAQRAAFINSVAYCKDSGSILATFFHEGKLFSIDRNSGMASPLISDMRSPHGGKDLGIAFLATSTATGEVVLRSDSSEQRFQFRELPNKAPEMGSSEWLQNTIADGHIYITVDSNRNAFVLFDPKAKKWSLVPYDPNWAVQDLVSISFETEKLFELQPV